MYSFDSDFDDPESQGHGDIEDFDKDAYEVSLIKNIISYILF